MRKQLLKVFILSLTFLFAAANNSNAQVGTWHALTNLPPHSNEGICLLMTDGTVICHNSSGGGYGVGWDKLTPDIHGSYINGTWTSVANMNNNRLFFSTQVLPSGKVYAAGGEYGPGGTNGEVFDPVANTWTLCGPIPGGWNIYDGNSEILYNGTVLEGPQIGSATSYNILTWSPTTLLYTTQPNSIYNHDEAEWVKLPDSSVLFVGIASQNANRYIPQTATWVTDAGTPGKLYDPYGEEAGCGLMLPNGKAIFFGATPYNCVYTPSGNHNPGTWTTVDSFPKINGSYMGQPDASGAMMVNGHILLACSPIGTSPSNEFLAPAYFVEYNYLTNTFTQVKGTIPGQPGDSIGYIACFQTQMLDLPDGNVLVSISQTGGVNNQYYIYTPGSAAIPQGKPTINNIIPQSCSNYKITGKLFNGISEGAAYGDDWQASTNWPIVRLTNGTNVYYAKTSNWNRIGAVRTDSLEDTAYFTIPAIPAATYSLVVVANGFASNPVLFSTVLGASASTINNVSCNGGSNGTAYAGSTNGFAPYTYAWTPLGGTRDTATGLHAGTYTVTVKSACGNSASAVVTITQPNILTGAAGVTVQNIICNGNNSGSAAVSTIGGGSPFTYLWTPSGETTDTATGLSAGAYTVKVNDGCGASVSATVSITQPIALNITSITSNISCHGNSDGKIAATVKNGTLPYTYSWAPLGATTANITGLSSGTYTLDVTDYSGCSGSSAITITQPLNPLNISAITLANVLCYGDNDGSASGSVSGGVVPYTYLWTAGGGTNAISSTLKAGADTITVTDAHGCSASARTVVTQPPALVVIRDSMYDNGSCSGSAWVVATGGTSPYTYLWTDGNTTYFASGLCYGNYCCTVADANGCLNKVCITVNLGAGVNNIKSGSGDIDVYPNPNNGAFTIQINNEESTTKNLEIYNVLGERIYSQLNIQVSQFNINLSSQPPGIYLYRVITDDGNLIGEGKLMIQK